ncbi:hypothetical protein [Klebsiella aerogenes]|uniref:hypothetical protein n=1 Tax=Klebsiella aerogenes TaxID=548 RepID=UPI002D7EA6E2|nr:hypothetical protein [Klebsiella aerogenes]
MTIEEIFIEAGADASIIGNVDGNQTAEQRKTELLKLVKAINEGKINKSKIVEYVKTVEGAKLTSNQVSKWLEGSIPVTKRDKASEAPVSSYQIGELEHFAIEAIKKTVPDIWEQALKDGFQIKKDKQMKELEDKLNAERDALLEELTKPRE